MAHRIRGAESGRGVGTPARLRTPRKICTLPTRWRNSGARSPTRPGEFKILNPPRLVAGPRDSAQSRRNPRENGLRATPRGPGGRPWPVCIVRGGGGGPQDASPPSPLTLPAGIVRGAHTFPTWGAASTRTAAPTMAMRVAIISSIGGLRPGHPWGSSREGPRGHRGGARPCLQTRRCALRAATRCKGLHSLQRAQCTPS